MHEALQNAADELNHLGEFEVDQRDDKVVVEVHAGDMSTFEYRCDTVRDIVVDNNLEMDVTDIENKHNVGTDVRGNQSIRGMKYTITAKSD